MAVLLGLAMVMLWACFYATVASSDLAKYKRWKHMPTLYNRVVWWENHLPRSLAQNLRLSVLHGKYVAEHQKLGAALVASGYLTNVIIAAGTNSAQPAAITARMRKAHEESDNWAVSLRREGVVITCRPEDALRCRQLFQQ